MKTFKDIISELTDPTPRRQKEFIDKHTIQVIDYPAGKPDQLSAKNIKKDKTKKASHHDGEDAAVYEAVEISHDRYMRSHGKKASGGEGTWMFTHKRMGDVNVNDSKEVHSARGKFSDAAKSAKEWAKKHGHSTAYVMEEVELDEVSDKKLDAYRQKAFADQPSGDDGSDKYRKRKFGRDLAFAKQTGRAKVLATKEEVEQIDEISQEKLRDYHAAAGADRQKAKAEVEKGMKNPRPSASSVQKTADAYKRFVKRGKGMTAAANKMDEETMSDAEMKKREDIVKGMKKNKADFQKRYGDRWKSVMYATATKSAMKEEAEQIDEISRDLARRYIRKATADNKERRSEVMKPFNSKDMAKNVSQYKKMKSREKGIETAGKKAYDIGGKAKVPARESVDLDEAFKAGSMKLKDGSSATVTKESADVLNSLFKQLNSANKAKMEERLMSDAKGFNEILAFAKEVA